MSENSATVATPREEYNVMYRDWQLCRDLMPGTRSMWDAGKRWLVQWGLEDDPDYTRRLNDTILFNAFSRSVRSLAGKALGEPISISEDTNPKLAEWFENIDLTGRHLNTFAQALFKDGLQTGLFHILIDKPRETARNLGEELQLGIRPYWVHVPAENMIWWYSETKGGVEVLEEVRIAETLIEQDGKWGLKETKRIRVLRVGEWELYEQMKTPKGHDWIIIDSGQTDLSYIPLVTVYFNRTGFMTASPPLLDLAFLNLAHWRSQSVQTHVLEIGRRPLPYLLGFDPKKVTRVPIGPHSALINAQKDASVGFAEITGASIGAGQSNLETLKDEMAAMSVELLVRKPGDKTATQTKIQTQESNSELGAMVMATSDGLENAAKITSEWGGLGEYDGSIDMSTEFELNDTEQAEIDQLLKMRTAGEITRRTFLEECQRRDLFGGDFTVDGEMEQLDREEVPPAPPTADVEGNISAFSRGPAR